ncbi:MAG TPA: radical SAM protein [Verrucomicrobiae bacterium]|nr:radical SAM protein [Verrucomicrobiae bacterium]
MELMEALIPLRLRWSTLWSAHLCLDNEFLDLAQRAGLLHVNVGIESIDSAMLARMNKRQNKADRYAEMFANLRRRGISYSLNFIFGWDHEGPDVYGTTLKFLQEHKVPVAYFNILTPQKGTALFDRLQSEGRILNADDIERWPGQNCHVRVPYCTPTEMEHNIQHMYREFYSTRSMLSRLPPPITRANIALWSVNLSERRMARAAQGHNDFDQF